MTAGAVVFLDCRQPGKQFYRIRPGVDGRNEESRVADAQGNDADDRHRVRIRRRHGAFSVGRGCESAMGREETAGAER